jgi:anaerobic selenocysteine-containing dehydrogenase
MTEFNRREFLKIVGAATAGAALANVDSVWAVPDELVEQALRGPGIETFKKTVCQLCPAGCGINVRLIDGIPVHIDGSKIHPVNRGGICPHGAAGLDFLYNPDRIRGPMLRVGPVGDAQWKTISWDEAILQIATRLQSLRNRNAPEEVAFFVREERGLMHEMITRFMQAIGSRNVLAVDEKRHDVLPYELLFGWKATPEYDIERAQYLLAFGADFLEDGVSPVHGIHAYSRMRDREIGGRGRLVYADSRHSLTAANSDRFLPIKAGTHGALALGVAYVLIKERYYDEALVNKYVTGFESWTDTDGTTHKGFRDLVLEHYYPERVASITGVPARTVVEVARDFGRIRPAVAITGSHCSGGTNGLTNALAVLSLNVLVGNIERPGGLRMTRPTPFRPLRPAPTDGVARRGLEKEKVSDASSGDDQHQIDAVLTFCDNVPSGRPYPVDTLFIYGTNPAFDHPYAKRIRQALERIPLVVSFASFKDETSEFADLILPQHTYLEGWMDSGATPGIAFAHAAVGQPVVEPFYETRHTGDVLIQITQALEGGVNRAFERPDFLSMIQDRMHGVYASGEGTVVSGSFEESWVQFLKERGWQNLVYESFDDFWKVLVERGGWWDPITEELPRHQWLRTGTGKIPLDINRLAGGRRNGDRRATGETENEGVLPLFEAPRFFGDEKEFPYHLITFGVLSNRDGSGSYSPLLQEMFGYYRRLYWDSWVELNPHTAHNHRIDEGDWVTITSESGSITTRAMFNEAMEPSAVAVPFGLGHTSGGRYAEGVGVNPYEIIAEVSDPFWGKPTKAATRVKIQKAARRVG